MSLQPQCILQLFLFFQYKVESDHALQNGTISTITSEPSRDNDDVFNKSDDNQGAVKNYGSVIKDSRTSVNPSG